MTNKPELIPVTSKSTKHLHNVPTSLTSGNAQIPIRQYVRSTSDFHLTMNEYISTIAQACHFDLRRLATIRKFLMKYSNSHTCICYCFVKN